MIRRVCLLREILMSQNNEQGQRLFEKCITLLEQRLKVKIKNAVLIVDTDYGEAAFELHEKKQPETVMLVSGFFHEKLIKLISRSRVGSSIITCDICLGAGEVYADCLLRTCSKCKGGGKVVQILNREQIDSSSYLIGQNDPLNNES